MAKKSGDNSTAMEYIKIAKQFDRIIDAVNNGQPVDLSNMPGPPNSVSTPQLPTKQEEHVQQHSGLYKNNHF